MILDASKQHENRIWDFKHKRGHTNSSANPNYIRTHLIPGSAKKSPSSINLIFGFRAPFPPKPNVGCIWGVLHSAKKIRSCCSYGPCVCSNIGHRGKGGQTFVIDSCPADFFFRRPRTRSQGTGDHLIVVVFTFLLFPFRGWLQ